MMKDDNHSCSSDIISSNEKESMSTTSISDGMTDKPGDSSAAQCIEFCSEFPSKITSFRPEFTHQCFEGEWIKGYAPMKSLDQQQLNHKTYVKHYIAKKKISVKITLAPSCESSHVQLDVCEITNPLHYPHDILCDKLDAEDQQKSKSNNCINTEETDKIEDQQITSPKKRQRVVTFQLPKPQLTEPATSMKEEDHTSTHDSNIKPKPLCLSEDQIRIQLQKALPPITTAHNHACQTHYLSKPLGRVIQEYTRITSNKFPGHTNSEDTDGSNNDETSWNFVLTECNGEEAKSYHDKVQPLALWFIETADCVDTCNTDDGYWKVIYLFHKTSISKNTDATGASAPRYALAGYLTLFHFRSPFKKPKPGIVVRICQALVLPPYQRQGHGRRLLKAVHKLAEASSSSSPNNGNNDNNEIVEINVEDPAPGFVALRNKVDLELLEDSINKKHNSGSSSSIARESSVWQLSSKYFQPDTFLPLSEIDAIRAGGVARILPKQVQIAYELFKLKQQQQQHQHQQPQEQQKQYRLMVKKRLLKTHANKLSQCTTKSERQALLAQLFDQVYNDYKRILKI